MRTKRIDEIELYIREKNLSLLIRYCEVFNVSKNTVRRDIATLEQSGKIKKVLWWSNNRRHSCIKDFASFFPNAIKVL